MGETISIVGGGQLGAMLTEAAKPLGFDVVVTNPGENGPAARVGAREIVAPLDDEEALDTLAGLGNVMTWEIEHIPANYLIQLEREGANIQSSPHTLATIQDKLAQKRMLEQAGIPVAPFTESLIGAPVNLNGGPYVVKTRMGGYDGRGNIVTDDLEDKRIARELKGPLYVEKAVDFDKELSVIAARDLFGQVALYPVVETQHVDSQCHTTIAPARIASRAEQQALDLARDTMKVLNGAGVFAMEMFQVGDDMMINEIAPRVHNSGHWTIEGAVTSQFEQHIRAISGLPLGSTEMRAPVAVMVNVLGREGTEGFRKQYGLDLSPSLADAVSFKDTHIHMYGKETKPNRKIGHVTALAEMHDIALRNALGARNCLPV